MKRKLNVKLLVSLLAVLIVLGAGVHFLHAYQVKRNAGKLLTQAARAEEQGEIGQALTHLARYLALKPDDIETLLHSADLIAKLPSTPRTRWQAATALEQVIRRDPQHHDARRKLAHLMLELGRTGDAREHLEILLRDPCPNDGELEGMLGHCQEAAGDFQRAARTYAAAIQHAPQRVATYRDLALLLRRRLDQGRQADAIMEKLVASNPKDARAYLARAEYRSRFGLAGRVEDVRRAAELEPNQDDVLLASAELLREAGQRDEARTRLTEAIRRHTRDARFYFLLARLHTDAGHPDEAIACLRRGLEQLPNDSTLLWSLAETSIQAGKLTEASDLLTRMLRAGYSPARLGFLQARLLMVRGQWSEAIQTLERARPALVSAPDLLKQLEMALAHCHGELGSVEQKAAACRRALAIDPRWLPAREGLAVVLLETGKLDEALTEYRQLLALPNAPASARLAIARVRLAQNLRLPERQREWQETEDAVDRAAQALPGKAEVAVLQAQLLVARGKADAARLVLEQARDKQPKQIEVWTALVDLAERSGGLPKALETLDAAQKQLGDRVELRLVRAQHLCRSRTAEAKEGLEELARGAEQFAREDQTRLLAGLAGAQRDAGNLGAARRLWAEVVKRKPGDLRIQSVRFDLAAEAGDAAEMQDAAGQLRRLEGSGGALWRYAEAARLTAQARGGDAKAVVAARAQLAEAAARRPGWVRVPLLEAQLDELEHNEEHALKKYQEALDLGERRGSVVRRVVQLLYAHQRYVEADQVLRRLRGEALLPADLGKLAAEVSALASDPQRALELANEAISPDSKDYRDHLWLGHILAAAGRTAEAEGAYRQAVKLAAQAPETWVALVQYLARTGQKEKAEEAIHQAKAKLPADAAPRTLAYCWESVGRREEAEASYRAALAARPSSSLALLDLAGFFLRTNQGEKAEPALRKVISAGSGATDAERAGARRGLAFSLAVNGSFAHFREALAILDENRKASAENVDDLRARATVLATQCSHRREAIRLLEELRVRQPLAAGDRFLLAQLYEANRESAKARELLLGLLASPEAGPGLFAYQVRSLLQRGEAKEAALWLERLEKRQPVALETIDLGARVLHAQGRTEAAARVVEEYAARKDADLLKAAEVLADIGRPNQAEALYREALAATPTPDAALPFARFLARTNRVRDGLDVWEKATASAEPGVRSGGGLAVVQAGPATEADFRRVEAWLTKASPKELRSPSSVVALAQLRYLECKYQESANLFREALALDGKNVSVLNNLAWLTALTENDPDRAMELLRRATEMAGPVTETADRRIISYLGGQVRHLPPDLLDTQAVIYLVKGESESAVRTLEEGVAAAPTATRCYHLAQAQRMRGSRAAATAAMRQAIKLGLNEERISPLERQSFEKLTGRSPAK